MFKALRTCNLNALRACRFSAPGAVHTDEPESDRADLPSASRAAASGSDRADLPRASRAAAIRACYISLVAFILVGCLLSACGTMNTGNPANSTANNAGSNPSNTTASTTGSSATDSDATSPGENSASEQEASGVASVKRNFYFIFDGSGSMRHPPAHASASADKTFGSKAQGAKWAVHEFISKVPDDVNLGLFVFDRRGARQLVRLSAGNREEFLRQIDAVEPMGNTPLGRAISIGVKELEKQYNKQLGYGEFRLIVLTDGEATDSLASGVNEALRYKIPIYTIGFDMPATHALRKHSVSYRAADSASEVEQALEAAGAELDVYGPTAFKGGSAK